MLLQEIEITVFPADFKRDAGTCRYYLVREETSAEDTALLYEAISDSDINFLAVEDGSHILDALGLDVLLLCLLLVLGDLIKYLLRPGVNLCLSGLLIGWSYPLLLLFLPVVVLFIIVILVVIIIVT